MRSTALVLRARSGCDGPLGGGIVSRKLQLLLSIKPLRESRRSSELSTATCDRTGSISRITIHPLACGRILASPCVNAGGQYFAS